MLEVTIEIFDDLSDEEKDYYGWYTYDNFLRIKHNGKTILFECDDIPPEDVNFHRDLSWIPNIIKEVYELGLQDGKIGESPKIDFEKLIKQDKFVLGFYHENSNRNTK